MRGPDFRRIAIDLNARLNGDDHVISELHRLGVFDADRSMLVRLRTQGTRLNRYWRLGQALLVLHASGVARNAPRKGPKPGKPWNRKGAEA